MKQKVKRTTATGKRSSLRIATALSKSLAGLERVRAIVLLRTGR